MPGSSISCTKMLPLLLLPLFISCHLVSSQCKIVREVTTDIFNLGNSVKHCPENCSSANITDICKCLNVSQGDRASPGYFIEGLESLHSNIPSSSSDDLSRFIRPLIRFLNHTNKTEDCKEKMKRCWGVSLLGKPSPKSFLKKLLTVTQQMKSAK